jgi:hypothetical protein
VVCPSRSGMFPCGTASCDRATTACITFTGGQGPTCVPYGTRPYSWSEALAIACGSCPSCGCLSAISPDAGLSFGNFGGCQDDGEGGVTIAQNACYGAPPARSDGPRRTLWPGRFRRARAPSSGARGTEAPV